MGILSKIKDTLNTGKDVSASLVARKMIEKRFSRYGSIRQLSLDSKSRRLHLEVMLAGETEPISLDVQRYELIKTAEGSAIVIREAVASREWINQLLADLVIGRSFSLPPKYESVLSLFV